MNSNTETIDIKILKKNAKEFLRERCFFRNKMIDKEDFYYCNVKYNNRCRNSQTYFVDYPDCPDTCPHHVRNLPIRCDANTKCKHLDNELKEFINVLTAKQ